MLYRILIYLTGFGFAVAGGINIIAYLNLLTMGNSYSHYIFFIFKRPECYLFLIGIWMITIAVYRLDSSE